jgi:ribosomal protein S17E
MEKFCGDCDEHSKSIQEGDCVTSRVIINSVAGFVNMVMNILVTKMLGI